MGEKIRGKEEYFILPENVLGILLSFGKFRDEGEFDLVGLLPILIWERGSSRNGKYAGFWRDS
ncbi:hypothetical protein [Blautia hydrogenotrophica]|uniref:hypothetical protein n=1 Tax=Blautia hydrogenotrophica TaxID=53443 RepID=UPI00399A478D